MIPIHWDSFTGPIEGPFGGSARARDSSRAETTDARVPRPEGGREPGIAFQTLPRYEPVVLF